MSKALNLPPGASVGQTHSPTTWVRGFIAWVHALHVAWQAWRTYRREVARLQSMDARMLRDIGLTRSEIGTAVRFGRYGG